MDGRKDQIVFVQQRNAGLIGCRVRRVERQFGQEAFTRRISASYLFELNKIGAPCFGVLMDAVEMRLIPEPGAFQIRWPFRRAEVPDSFDENGPIVAGARWTGKGEQ